MSMDKLIIKHNELTAEEFIELWSSVWDGAPTLEQTNLAMNNTIFRVSVFDGDKVIAMARVIGDMGLCYYIKDVVVKPEYQGKGIGRILINELKKFINDNERIALRIIKYALMYYGNMSKEEILDNFNKELSGLFGLEEIVNKIKIPSEYDSSSKYHYIALKIFKM